MDNDSKRRRRQWTTTANGNGQRRQRQWTTTAKDDGNGRQRLYEKGSIVSVISACKFLIAGICLFI